jgi:hypothetical protein
VRLVLLVAVLAFASSACSRSGTPGVAALGTATTSRNSASGSSAATGGSTGSGTTGPGDVQSASLALANCMRANGVPDFPDPSASGGFVLGAGIDPSSPAVRAAQEKCQKLMPGGGPPGSGPPPSAQAVAQMLKVSQCMRAHGISGFPDPTTSVPSNLAGVGVANDRDGVILVFPRTLDTQSPAFTQAAAACAFALHNH